MGAGESKYIPQDVPPPRRNEDDYPVLDAIGIGKGMAEGCQRDDSGAPCQLAVPQGVSSSGAKLYREQGSIRRDQCKRWSADLEKVSKKQKAFEEVKKDLIAGLYYEDLNNGYCRQMLYDAKDIVNARSVETLPMDKVRYMTIRKVSDSGGYSAVTKLFIKPAIPFEIEFNGRPHKVTVLTIMHPSPIRIENIQHDAMLTLGDASDGNNDGLVVLVPLQGAITAGQSGDFINKIVRYMSGVLQPDPATGDYQTIDIPTGNDWKLSKLFSSTPGQDGKTYVNEPGYYAWVGYPPLELRPEGNATPHTDKPWFANWYLREPGVQRYSWQPKYGRPPVRYVMLSKPALVNSMDLQTIRMLPVTPVTEAVAPIYKPSLSYRMAGSIGPDGTWISACSASPTSAITTDLFSRERMENPVDMCDPFAPGAFPEADSNEALIQLVIAIFTTISVGLAIYLAVLFFTKTKWGRWVAHQGTIAGNKISQAFVTEPSKVIPVDTMFDTQLAEAEDKAKEEEKLRKDKAEEQRAAKEKAKEGAELMAKEKEEAKAKEAEDKAKAKEAEDKAKAAKAAKAKDEIDFFPNAETRLAAPASVENPAHRRGRSVEAKKKEAVAKAQEDDMAARAEARLAAPASMENPALPPHRRGRSEDKRAELAAKREEAKAEAKKAADEKAKAEAEAKKAADEKAKAEAEAKAAADEQAKKEAEAKKAADDQAKAEAEAKKAADEKAKAEAEAEQKKTEEAKAVAEAERKKAEEAKKAADEQAKAEAEAKAAAEASARYTKQAQDAFKEAEEKERAIKAAAEEAAKSASKAAERQAAPLKRRVETSDRDLMTRAEAERKKQAEEYAAKKKEADASEFRPTSGRASAAVPAPTGVKPPSGHPPPTEAEVKSVVDAVTSTDSDAKAAARRLASPKKSTLTESEQKEVKDKLTKLRATLYDLVAGAVRVTNLNRSTWKNRSAWMRFEQEKNAHTRYLVPLVKKLAAYKDEVEGSGLDALQRAGFETGHAEIANKTLRLLTESKRRLQTLDDDAPPPIFSGGRRRNRNRKSTRRYVA